MHTYDFAFYLHLKKNLENPTQYFGKHTLQPNFKKGIFSSHRSKDTRLKVTKSFCSSYSWKGHNYNALCMFVVILKLCSKVAVGSRLMPKQITVCSLMAKWLNGLEIWDNMSNISVARNVQSLLLRSAPILCLRIRITNDFVIAQWDMPGICIAAEIRSKQVKRVGGFLQ